MTEYLVLIPGDEAAWAAATQEDRNQVYAQHTEFHRLLEERGHKVLGGAELADTKEAKTVRNNAGVVTVTDGPYAETVEQLTGFYQIESDNLDDLLEVCKVLGKSEGGLEVRRILRGSDS